MKYELRNKNTGEKHLCKKVTIDKGDFYYIDKVVLYEELVFGRWYYSEKQNDYNMFQNGQPKENYTDWKEIIATNASAIKIPKVIDEVEELAKADANLVWNDETTLENEQRELKGHIVGFIEGYNKHAETHPFSEGDMLRFAVFYFKHCGNIPIDELLKTWKNKQPQVLYFV